MSIRLNKALRELNIGLQTAVEFLEKKSELGEVKPELSFKLNDDQYGALVEAFKQDAEVRNQAEKIFQKKPKEKKRPSTPKEASSAPKDNRAEELLKTSSRQQYNPIGKIDLDSIGKTSAAKEPVAQDTTPQASQAAQEPAPKLAAAVSSEPEKKETVKPVEAKVAQPAPAPEALVQPETPQKEEKPASKKEKVKVEKPVEKQVQPKEEEAPQKETEVDDDAKNDGDELFQTKSELKMQNAPKVNVLGKIDLSAINQSTRPKKKTKEERRKEREEKRGGRKKRVRINQERVDINAASKQIGGNAGNNRPNSQEGGRNANKKNNRKTRNKNFNQKPLEVNEEEVARQVKETLARLTSKGNQTKKGARYRKEKRDAIQERMSAEERAERKDSKILKLTEFVTVSELASMMDVDVNKLIGTLMSVGLMVSINQRLDAETINLVADEFGFKTEYVSAEVQEAVAEEMDDENDLVSRAPIVTVMGHVDHGKTSLLDHIRNTNVIAGEAGGITQHIGAYNVKLENGRNITFLDTPGHEAFTAMRARGTQVTDIAIIIIAADDSVMPTTKEAIAHAQAANVPMVFAINKIDKPGANPDKIREDLAQMNLLVEDWGGKYQCQEISAKKGIG